MLSAFDMAYDVMHLLRFQPNMCKSLHSYT